MRLWVFRENPYRIVYDSLGGQLLPQDRSDEFGGAMVTSVSYDGAIFVTSSVGLIQHAVRLSERAGI